MARPRTYITTECPECGFTAVLADCAADRAKLTVEAVNLACPSCDEPLEMPRVAIMRTSAAPTPPTHTEE